MAGASAAGAESFSVFFAASCSEPFDTAVLAVLSALSARDLSTRRCLPPERAAGTSVWVSGTSVLVPVPHLRPGRGRQTRPAFAPIRRWAPACVHPPACYRTSPSACGAWAPTAPRDPRWRPARPRTTVPTTRCPPRPHPPTSRSPRPARCPGCWRSPRRCPAQPRVHRPDPHTGRTRRFVPHVAGRVLELGSHRLLVSNLTERTVCNPDHMCLPGKNHQTGSRGELSLRCADTGDRTAPTGCATPAVRGARAQTSSQTSARSAGTSNASARPRCDAASFSAGLSSAADRSDPTGTNTGS